MSQKYIYQIANLTKKHGQREVLKDIWLAFYPGAKIGVLGAERVGQEHAAAHHGGARQGVRRRSAAHRRVYGWAAWNRSRTLDPEKTVFENVEEAVAPTRALLKEFEEIGEKYADVADDPDAMEKLMNRQAALQDRIDTVNAWELDRQVEIAMSAMNLPPGDADVTKLSGGERRRVALCKILLERPDLLLLDEPTNHLDAESVAWLERHLAEYPGTIVAVTHDRYFLDNVAGWILELDRGQGIPWEGNYSSWLRPEGRSGSPPKKNRSPLGRGRSPASWSGSAWPRRRGTRKTRPASRPTSGWRPSSSRTGPMSWRSKSRPGLGWATWSLKPRGLPRPLATGW